MRYFILVMGFLSVSVFAEIVTVTQMFNVQTVKVQQENVAKTIKSFGFVKVDDSLVYDVSPRFGGFIEMLYADKVYQKVNKGEALAKVYSPEVLKAKDEYINSLRYSKNKTMAQSAMTKLKLLDIPSSEINTKVKNRDFTTIVSPASGYVFKKFVNNNASFNAKKTLFEIVNLDRVWVEVKIHQDQLALLESIDSYTLTTASTSKKFTGVTSKTLYPQLDPKEESFTLRLELKNPNTELKPGMYMSVIMNQAQNSYLTLPTTAVIRKHGRFYVFVVGEYEGEYEPLEVEVNVLNPETYIVKSGLVLGDEVVNNALFMMDSDAQINGMY